MPIAVTQTRFKNTTIHVYTYTEKQHTSKQVHHGGKTISPHVHNISLKLTSHAQFGKHTHTQTQNMYNK